MFRGGGTPLFNRRDLYRGRRAARHIMRQLGLGAVDLIGTPHHDNHAWFSFAVSPFAHQQKPVMVAVLDRLGNMGAISLYLIERGRMQRLYSNDSVFDSLGIFYRDLLHAGWLDLAVERGGATCPADEGQPDGRDRPRCPQPLDGGGRIAKELLAGEVDRRCRAPFAVAPRTRNAAYSYSTSSTCAGGPPKAFCANAACMKASRSPSSTASVFDVETPVRRSFTI
jgi:hypothetical protein